MEARPNFDSMPTKAEEGAVAARATAAAAATVVVTADESVCGYLSCLAKAVAALAACAQRL